MLTDRLRRSALPSGSWSLPSAQPPSSPGPPISWSPDGKSIVFTKMPNAYDADSDGAVVCALELPSGKIPPLTSHGKYEGFGEFSPDGTHVAYWYPAGRRRSRRRTTSTLRLRGGGDGTDVTVGRRSIPTCSASIWMPDSKKLLISGHKDTDAALWIKPLDGKSVRLDLARRATIARFLARCLGRHERRDRLCRERAEPSKSSSTTCRRPDSAPQRLTSYNDAIAALDLGAVRAIQWQNDGFAEDGVVTLPPGYDSARTYPLVLVIHGGPNSASITAFSGFNQLLAARGYIVFNPNYRGSDNLGAKYWYGIVNDSGAGPGRDVMAGIAALEAAVQNRYLAHRRLGLVVRRLHDLVDDRPLPYLEGGGFRCGGQRSDRRVCACRQRRRLAVRHEWLALRQRPHEELHRSVTDQRCLERHDADVDLERHRRCSACRSRSRTSSTMRSKIAERPCSSGRIRSQDTFRAIPSARSTSTAAGRAGSRVI